MTGFVIDLSQLSDSVGLSIGPVGKPGGRTPSVSADLKQDDEGGRGWEGMDGVGVGAGWGWSCCGS